MRHLLAIDTAGATAGAAVAVGEEVVAWAVQATAFRHSEGLFGLVEHVLRAACVARSALDCVAVTRGPGSFTGLRVGVAAAKGISYALGIPLVGVSSLEALARGAAPFPGVLLPILDARKGQVYGSAVDGLSGEVLLPERAWHPSELARAAAGLLRDCLLLGSGVGPYRRAFESALGERLHCCGPDRWPISPVQVAVLGALAARSGRASAPALLAPVYHRLSEAEEKRGERDPVRTGALG